MIGLYDFLWSAKIGGGYFFYFLLCIPLLLAWTFRGFQPLRRRAFRAFTGRGWYSWPQNNKDAIIASILSAKQPPISDFFKALKKGCTFTKMGV
ncbi:hypothetical protein D1646_10730 [Pseudoflavonifractor sp. 60]|nr:hypothetical protein [Pseudoflavonifractor sp. 60]